MNRSESKYFNTAAKLDRAFIELLSEKDFEYITVKEICHKADVNRSTFYLHYDTVADLLEESVEYVMSDFYRSFNADNIEAKITEGTLDELMLIRPEYLVPYLTYIRGNKKLFLTMIRKSKVLGLEKCYTKLFEKVLDPILKRFRVNPDYRRHMMTFYINGMIAVIMEWLKNDCKESIEEIASVLEYIVGSRADITKL